VKNLLSIYREREREQSHRETSLGLFGCFFFFFFSWLWEKAEEMCGFLACWAFKPIISWDPTHLGHVA
jgi:hypothetical protein